MIPILDLTRQISSLQPAITDAVLRVIRSGAFINGVNVAAFEREFASYIGSGEAVALNSGTDALHLALRAVGVGPGDEVITTPFTFVASTEAIELVGARPVFVDIDPVTFTIDACSIEAAITSNTKAILPVHLYGGAADMPRILELARLYGLAVVEDCAQSVGGAIGSRKLGTFGDVGCFSFFPSKNLGALGDGGMLVTDRPEVAARVRALRCHGGRRKNYHEEVGLNSRLDEIQAAVLRVKLPHLEAWIEARRAIAGRYRELLAAMPVRTPSEPVGTTHVYHQFTVRIGERDAVARALAEVGVQAVVYYPLPLHLQPVHRNLGYGRGMLPQAEMAAAEVLSIPMFPELRAEEQEYVARALIAGVLATRTVPSLETPAAARPRRRLSRTATQR